jgi:integrase
VPEETVARSPKLNFTPFLDQYTTTIGGVFHRLGKDKEAAETQFKFLMRQAEKGTAADPNVTFGDVADAYLDYAQASHCPERYRHCKERLQEFKDQVGDSLRARDLRARHVEAWLKGKELTGGSERLYKGIILACLNWAAKPSGKKGGGLIAENPLRGQMHLPATGSRGKEAVWSQGVFEQVLKVSSTAFADLVRILAWTGARPSTVTRIEARHYNEAQSRWDCEDLYSGRSTQVKYVRHVRLLNDESRELVERLNKKHPEGPIFRNAFGKPWTPNSPQIYLTNLQVKFKHSKGLDWPDGLCVYGLRHTFATNFLRQFPNEIEYLRVLLGHKNYKMIFAHYGHLIDEHASAFRRLEGFNPFTSGGGTSSSGAPKKGSRPAPSPRGRRRAATPKS